MNIPKRFQRIGQLIGNHGIKTLSQSHAAIIGLGAVGGFAAEALARSGIGTLTIVDFDIVQPSNINRQILALESTMGQHKHMVAQTRIKDINPDCRVNAIDCFVDKNSLGPLFEQHKPDIVIDAIDSLLAKVELLAFLTQNKIPVISSMGAALRTDPTKIKVGSLFGTHNCPLARQVRKRLRRKEIDTHIPCVYSTQLISELPPSAIDRSSDEDEKTLDRGRRRNSLGSLPSITGMFGLIAANEAIKYLLGGNFTSGNESAATT